MELLERDHFLNQLGAILKQAASGAGRTVLVGGEAGIGKTALVERFVERHRDAARILWGGCEALFTPSPLGPLRDIAGQTKSTVLGLLEAEAARASIFSAFLDDLKTGPAPVIVVFEDVHWADEATLDLIKFVGRRIQQTHALLVLTYRDDEVGARHPLRVVIGDLPSAHLTRVSLPPLSESAVVTLAHRAHRSAEGLYAITGGNPFFVTEILATGEQGVPPTVRDAVLARAARLSPAARATLDACAVVGFRIDPRLLAVIIGGDIGTAEECVAVGMLHVQDDAFTFRHELSRQAILEGLTPHRRAALHQAVLRALRASPIDAGDLARLAHHAEAAGDAQAVLEYAPAAASRASALGAHREAAAQYTRALRFATDLEPAQRASMLERYSEEAGLIDQSAESIRARQEAVRLYSAEGNTLKQGESLARLATFLVRAGRNAEAEQASRLAIEALEDLPPGPQLAQAYGAQAALRMLNRDSAEAVTWGKKAIAVAEQCGANSTIVVAHNLIGAALLVTGDERGRDHLEQSLRMALDAGLENYVAIAYVNLGSAYGEWYRFAEAERYLASGIAYSNERDLDQSRFYMLAWRALVHFYLGRWSEAADDALTVARRPGASAISRIMALIALGRVRARRGDPEVRAALDEALELATQTETLQRLAPARAARAEAAWLVGDLQAVREEARAAFDLAMRHEHPWFVGELAYWRWRAGDLDAPPPAAAEPFRLQMNGDWNAAAAAWARLGCPYEQARALSEGNEDAQRSALAIFEQLDARPAAEIVRRSLRARGVRGVPRGPRESSRANRAGLTVRELEVLSLLAGGLQNTEIARRLFVSAKTVDHHVSAILTKLGARSRTEAVAAAHRLGVIPQQ